MMAKAMGWGWGWGSNDGTALTVFQGMVVKLVPVDSPSRGGDIAVYVFDINQPSLSTPFYSVLVSISVLWSFQLYFIP